MLLNAKDTVFTFGGAVVGGILTYQFFRGDPQEAIHRPLSGDPVALPGGKPDHGRCQLQIMYDPTDLGQAKMRESYLNRTVEPCVLTWSNGNVQTFEGFTILMPFSGTKAASGDTSVASNAQIRINGPIN